MLPGDARARMFQELGESCPSLCSLVTRGAGMFQELGES